MLTGRYRKGQPLPDSLRVKAFPEQMADDRNLDAVERLIPIAEAAGLSLTHMGMAFVMTHPCVTSAILGPRTMQQLDDLLAGADVALSDEIMDRIDEVVAPGTDVAGLGLGASANYLGAGSLVAGVFIGSALWWLLLSCGAARFQSWLGDGWMRFIHRLSGSAIFAFGIYSLSTFWYRCFTK